MQTKIPQQMIVHYVDYDAPDGITRELGFAREEFQMKHLIDMLKTGYWYVPVAKIEYDDRLSVEENLENAYKLLQNGVVTDSWTLSPPDGVDPLVDPITHDGQQYGHRSMSMGDIITVGGAQYAVAFAGFVKIG
jgi:hypothetical protein